MLTFLRDAAQSWVAKLLLVILVLSFGVWGISGQIFGGLGTNVVTVGDTKVSVTEYRLAYDRQVSALSQQFGMPITREQARAFGIDNQVLGQLIAGAALDEQAREMRLGLSRDRLAALTAEDPAFRGPDGRFDRAQFEWALRQIGMRPQDYIRNREQAAVREQIVDAVSDGLDAPDTFLAAVARYRGEDRTVDYVVLPRSLVEPVAAPSEAEIAAFFEENKAAYAAPEYRRIAYVKLEPEDIADPDAITEEDARAYYDRTVSRYTTPERRAIEQLVFASEEAAAAALQKIRDGASFEEIVAEEGKTPADVRLGTFGRDQVADPAVAEAAFALSAAGDVSDVVTGAFGPILVRVTEITPEKVRPFAEVADEIRRDLAFDEATRVLTDVHDAYEDARASGESMAEAAARQRLKVVTVEAVDRSGKTPEGTILTDLPESNALLREAFETEVGVENPPIDVGSVGFLYYEVEGVTPARERALDEVRDRVVADWTEREANTRLAARAAETQKRLADGGDFAAIAQEMGLEVQTRRGLKRDTADAGLGEAGVAAAFAVARGEAATARGQEGDTQIVLKVTEVMQPLGAGADSLAEAERARIATGIGNDLLDQLVARLQGQYGVTIDRAAVEQALSF